jgi:hypothetical protein
LVAAGVLSGALGRKGLTVVTRRLTLIEDWPGVRCAGIVRVRGPILAETGDIFFGKLRAGSLSGVARCARLCYLKRKAKARSKSRSKAADRSVRSTLG